MVVQSQHQIFRLTVKLTFIAASFSSAFCIQGHRFTYQNTSLLLYRIHIPTPASNEDVLEIKGSDDDIGRLLDPSGAYLLEASIRVQDGSNVDLMKRGVGELYKLKETLKGVVELEAGERLAFDTRVR